MRLICSLIAAAGSIAAFAAPAPVWEWQFERLVNKSYLESENKTGKKLWMQGKMRKNAGVSGNALDCSLSSYNYIAELPMPWKAFTVEMKFKLDNPVNPKHGNTLLWYALHSWGRSDFLLKITPKKELMAQFFTKDSQTGKIKLSFTVLSKPQEIEPGKFYSIRVSSVSGGTLKIYLDGVLVAAKNNAYSFSDLTAGNDPRYYPLLIIGGESRTAKPRFQLDGVIDDLKIYNCELTGDDALSLPANTGNTSAVGNRLIPLSLQKPCVTAPFKVLDIDQQAGVVFTRAEQIFQKHAAHVIFTPKDNFLQLEFVCPVSPKHPVESSASSFWSGELVEFFWSDGNGYRQYCYNVSRKESNAFSYNRHGVKNSDFQSGFKVTYSANDSGYRVKMIIPNGELLNGNTRNYRVNFTRCGKSAGGKSSWADVGQNFHQVENFGLAVNDSLAGHLLNQLNAMIDQNPAGTMPEKLQKKISELKNFIRQNGDDPKNFDLISRRISNLENDLLTVLLAGKKLIIFQPDMWKNDLAPDLLTHPAKSFKITMPQNSTAYLTFAVSNMTGKRFLGRLKCMDELPKEKFDTFPMNSFPLDGGFFEAIPHEDNSGRSLYDALAELPMGQLLRIPPQETAAVWLKLKSSGITPGIYKTSIVLKSATEGFANEILPLEIEVLPVDLGKVTVDTALYNYIQARFINTRQAPKEELVKLLVEREVNYLYCNVPGAADMDIYPPFNADGTPGKCDFTHLDNTIDIHIACGMPQERIKLWFYLAMDYPGYVLKCKGKNPPFPVNSQQWNAGLQSFFAQLFEHCENKYGITPDRIIFTAVDEPRGDYNNPQSTAFKACKYARIIRNLAPQAKLHANPYDLKDDNITRSNFRQYAGCFDIIAPYSGQLTPNLIKFIKTLDFKEYWTYNILQKIHSPETYRRKIWENMLWGFSTVSPYWHVDQADGGDGLCAFDVSTAYGTRSNDYATIFCDFTTGKGLVSRRQEAFYLGGQDAKLIILCREMAQGRPEAELIEKIIARGAAGNMSTIEECYQQLLNIAVKLGSGL